jgi:light-independent protochlorophyllide reductase subunit B
MQLTLWTYEGPPHVGAMRIATSMRDVHYVLHAPQGDTYADLLFTMIERRDTRPPVTYTTFQARDLGGDTAELVKVAVQEAYDRFRPAAMLVGESCTAELIQDQPGSLAEGMGLPVPIVPLELPAYSKKENWGASETFYHLVRALLLPHVPAPGTPRPARPAGQRPKAALLGPTLLGFRNRDDVREVTRLLADLGVDVDVVAPMGATCDDLRRLPACDLIVCLYPEVAETTCRWLGKSFGVPVVNTVPIGVGATREFIAEVGEKAGVDVSAVLAREAPGRATRDASASLMPWYSRSVDSTYLTGKRVFVFGDATHVKAAVRIARDELGFTVVGLGTYSREYARDIRALAKEVGVEPVITDDYLDVETAVGEAAPELVLGTQMERHIAKRLGIPCAVISTPIHVQDVPARHSPQMGFEGANVIFDTWVHPLMMGLEEHLLHMFREDFEFRDEAVPSHLASVHAASGGASAPAEDDAIAGATGAASATAATAATATAATATATLTPPMPAEAVVMMTDDYPIVTATPPAGGAATTDVPADAAGATPTVPTEAPWLPDAERELKKIPFFVRGKAKRNTERYARDHGLAAITVDTLYEAKAHYGR